MRSDENLKTIQRGGSDLGDFGAESPRNSFSGGERDNLFLSDRGEQFYDIAGLAGLDDPGDGRTSSFLDFDRDGWVDMVIASATEPTLKLYRNRIGDELYSSWKPRFVAIRLQGGNQASTPNTDWSPREGYGAIVTLSFPDENGKTVQLVREYRCGDGRATQNSRTMVVGVGDATRVDVEVLWPSGKRQVMDSIASGSLLVGFENPAHNGGKTHTVEPYILDIEDSSHIAKLDRESMRLSYPTGDTLPRLHVITAMSTHCKSCKKAQPQIEILRQAFGDTVGVWGVPVDLDEGKEVLDAYVDRFKPHYDVLSQLPMDERSKVKEHITKAFLDEVTPATIITDAEGNILKTMQGVPTLSQVRAHLAGR